MTGKLNFWNLSSMVDVKNTCTRSTAKPQAKLWESSQRHEEGFYEQERSRLWGKNPQTQLNQTLGNSQTLDLHGSLHRTHGTRPSACWVAWPVWGPHCSGTRIHPWLLASPSLRWYAYLSLDEGGSGLVLLQLTVTAFVDSSGGSYPFRGVGMGVDCGEGEGSRRMGGRSNCCWYVK